METNLSLDKLIEKWLNHVEPEHFYCSFEPDYYEESEIEEHYLLFRIFTKNKGKAWIEIPLDRISNPNIILYNNNNEAIHFEGDVSICDILLKLYKKLKHK